MFLLLYVLFVTTLAASSSWLPERVATHFGLEGKANGWMSHGIYLSFAGAFPLVIALVFAGVAALAQLLPARYFNLPRRDFWLAPERRATTVGIIRSRLTWLLCLMTLFFAGLHGLTIAANRIHPPQLPMGGLLLLVIVFLVSVMIWMALMLMRFAETGEGNCGIAKPQDPSVGKSNAVPDEAGSKTGGVWRVLLSVVLQIAAALPLLAFMTFIVPKFEQMAREFGTHMPAVTVFAVNATNFASRYLLVLSVMAILLSWAMHRRGGRKWLWRWTAGVASIMFAWFVLMVGVVIIPMMVYGPQVIHRSSDAMDQKRSRYPKAAHISRSAGTVLVHHDDVDVHYVLYASNAVGSATSDQYNTHSLAWMDHGSFKVTEQQTFGYHRESTDPFHLQLNGKEYDLREGRVLVLHDDGTVEQLKVFPPLTVASSPDTLVKLFSAAREMNTEPVTIEKMRAQLETAEAQFHDVLKTCAPTHPFVVEVRESIGALKRKIGEQTGQPLGAASAAVTFCPVNVPDAEDLVQGFLSQLIRQLLTDGSYKE